MYIRRSSVFVPAAIALALMITTSLVLSPFSLYAQEASSTQTQSTTTDTTAPEMQTDTNQATNVEPTGETFLEQAVVAASSTPSDTQGQQGDGNGADGQVATVPGQVITATSTDGTGGQSDVGGTIVTGDATASTTVQNEMNSNTSNPDQPGETNSSSITASTSNEAELGSVASTSATTGDNAAEGGQGLATIVTGVAIATANVINVVNTNIFNSVGLVLFLNQLFGGGFDFRNLDLSYFFDDPSTTQGGCGSGSGGCGNSEADCTLLTCLNSSSLNVINTNTATVTNSVIVRASTGQNVASSSGSGGADVSTGDAYAAANVLNLVNTNVINSKYLVVSFNNFGNMVQDITLPTSQFFSRLLGQGTAMPEMNASTFDVNNTNGIDFTGTTTASAETGENTATTGTSSVSDLGATSTATSTPQGAEIQTGNAYSMSNSYTQANSNVIGATSLMLLFRVWGNWSGDVVGLPPGLKWERTADGIVIMTDTASEQMVQQLGQYNSSAFLASSTNNAVVQNNVDVSAQTGENQTVTNAGASHIETGDAYAVANVTNLVNTNVVNGNWIFGVFNVFGDWSGDIAFGHPDLSLEAVAVAPEPTVSGSDINYIFKVKNNGDMAAPNVTLRSTFNGDYVTLEDLPNAIENAAGGGWDLGTIGIGESKEFAVKGKIVNPSHDSYTVPVTTTVGSAAKDNDPSDNTKLVTVVVNGPQLPQPSGGGGGGGGGAFASPISPVWTKDPKVTVIKTASVTSAAVPATVDYKVVVNNDTSAGPAYRGTLSDVLYDPDGKVVYERSWNLDTIASGDEITLTYSVEFGTSTKPGMYKNIARVTGIRNYSTIGTGGVPMNPVEAQNTVEFSGAGQVLGVSNTAPQAVSTSGACAAYLTTFMARGLKNNSSDVMRLQQFLNTNMGSSLPVTGMYGPMTQSQVRAYQARSGIRPASGSVYSLTRASINGVLCGGAAVSLPSVPNTGGSTVAKTPAKTKSVAKSPVKAKVTSKPAAQNVAVPKPTVVEKPVVTPTKPSLSNWLKKLVPIASGLSR